MKDKIICESMEMFFRYGIKSITMEDIARDLGMSKKTLYQYFENKNDLLMACMDLHDQQQKAQLYEIQGLATNAIDEMIRIANYLDQMLKQVSPTLIFDVQKYHREAWDKMNKMHNEDVYKEIYANLERGVREGLYRTDFDIDIIAKIYVNTSLLGTRPDVFSPKDYKMHEILKMNILYHLHGIVSEKGLSLLQLMKEELN
ncbi:MAG: TetR/AcrR family transcriptional regulator [Saprospiraceae bacterium]